MQEVETFSRIKRWPKGFSRNNGYTDSSDFQNSRSVRSASPTVSWFVSR